MEIVIALTFGVVTAILADQRGRNAVGWFFIGFIFSCFGLILLLVLPDAKAQLAKENRLERENRRLRERVENDRRLSERRHVETSQRLSIHDQAIGVDTAPPLPSARAPVARIAAAERSQWWYAFDDERLGPVDFSYLRSLWYEGNLDSDSLVWTQGMNDWSRIDELPGMTNRLDA